MRPTTVLAFIAAALLGAFLILDHNLQHVKWHYWIAPVMMIGTSIALLQITVMYMNMVGRKELQSRPPSRD